MSYLENIGKKSKKAFEDLKTIKHEKIKKVLESYNKSLLINKQKIIRENKSDIKNVKRNNLVDRLILNDKRIDGIRHSINEIANFKNPIGRVLESWKRPNKLNIKKVATPIGVIGVIYESRPNVTADVAALCLKSGNCSILRGGSEAINSNKILANLFREALQQNKINKNCVQFIENKDRKIVDNLLSKMSNYIDVIVPRGGKGLISKVQKFSNVHVIGHLEGLCHIFIDKSANLSMAKKIIINAKMRRTSICGAVETLLIEEKALKTHAKEIVNTLIESGCEVRVDDKINKLFKNKLK
jgi:glutamate-5-semialdehyde dehydrogenase